MTPEELRERFGYRRAYTSYLEMLETEQPQAVCLNVPRPRPPRWRSKSCGVVTL